MSILGKLFGEKAKREETKIEVTPEANFRAHLASMEFAKAAEDIRGGYDLRGNVEEVNQALIVTLFDDPSTKREEELLRLIRTCKKFGIDMNSRGTDKARPIDHVLSNNYSNREFLKEATRQLVDCGYVVEPDDIRMARRNGLEDVSKELMKARIKQRKSERKLEIPKTNKVAFKQTKNTMGVVAA